MTPDSLLEHAVAKYGVESGSYAKLMDLALIWQTYRQLTAGRFSDSQAQQEHLSANIARSGVLTDACVFVYGFDLLQLPFCRMLAAALPVTRSMAVLMLCDTGNEGDSHIFEAQRQNLKTLQKMLSRAGLPFRRCKSGQAPAPRDPALMHL